MKTSSHDVDLVPRAPQGHPCVWPVNPSPPGARQGARCSGYGENLGFCLCSRFDLVELAYAWPGTAPWERFRTAGADDRHPVRTRQHHAQSNRSPVGCNAEAGTGAHANPVGCPSQHASTDASPDPASHTATHRPARSVLNRIWYVPIQCAMVLGTDQRARKRDQPAQRNRSLVLAMGPSERRFQSHREQPSRWHTAARFASHDQLGTVVRRRREPESVSPQADCRG